MTDVPEAVRLAVANRTETNAPSRPGTTPAFTESGRISRGDLRIVAPTAGDRPAESRLCLVLGVDPTDEFADVVLTHTAPELATSVDGVVPPELSGAPYDIVVQTDLRGAVWTLQLGRRVGWIDEPALNNLTSIVLGRTEDPDSSGGGLHAGIPLQGPADRRWSFKEEEGAELRRLTANCTDAVLDGDSVWEIDSGLLVSDHLGEPDDQVAIVAELWEWTRTRRTRHVTMTDDALAQLLDSSGTGLERWSDVSDLGMDLSTSIWDLAADISTNAPSSELIETSVRCLLTADHLPTAEHESFEQVHYLGQRDRVSA